MLSATLRSSLKKMSQVFKYHSWVKLSTEDKHWTPLVGYFTLQGDESREEICRAAIKHILTRGDEKDMFLYRLQIKREKPKND